MNARDSQAWHPVHAAHRERKNVVVSHGTRKPSFEGEVTTITDAGFRVQGLDEARSFTFDEHGLFVEVV